MPRGHPLLSEIARALGDESVVRFCEQADMTEVLIGKRMCG